MKDIISMTIGDIQTEIDNGIMRAVRNVGVNVSKEELIEALELNEKLVRCKDCKYFRFNECEMWGEPAEGNNPTSEDGNDYCSWGERADHE